MAQHFRVRAMDAQQRLITLPVSAASAEEARQQVLGQGMRVLSVDMGRASLARAPRFDLTLFSQELLALVEAGLALVESLEALRDKEIRSQNRAVLDRLVAALYQGQTLSQAMAADPATFPELYVMSVRAGESTGDIGPTLTRYIAYVQRIDVVRSRLISAALYPVLLLLVGMLVALFLLVYLVPKFSRIYEGLHTDLPFLSRMLLAWGDLLLAHPWGIAGTALALIGAVIYGLRQPSVRRGLLAAMKRQPRLGEKLVIFQLTRFYRTAAMLLAGGIPLVAVLERVGPLLSAALQPPLSQAIAAIRRGEPLAETLASHGLTTPVALRLLRVGEQSGRLAEMMERIAQFYDDELGRTIDTVTRLMEPVLMLTLGLFIGMIVVALYLPIFDLAGSLR